jgi:tetratricopeptide (TPR) repeat protein
VTRLPYFQKLYALLLAVVLASLAGLPLAGQSPDDFEACKKQAIQLFHENKFTEALPIFDKLHNEKPDDNVVLEFLSFSTLANSAALKDPEARQQERAKARKLADQANAAGKTSNLLKIVLEVPPDGSQGSFSLRADVDDMMRQGEAAFVKGDFDAATEAYSNALLLDPQQYEAALFLGDVNFKRSNHELAAKWFQRAIQIDPQREIAYRYWGDDLVAQGKMQEAGEQFISAVVANPYDHKAWIGLSQWAQKQKITLSNPDIRPPGSVEDKAKDAKGQGQINITIDTATMGKEAEKTGKNAWFIYSLSKATWHGDRFKKEFPNEPKYRHSLAEEVDGYQVVVDQIRLGLKNKKISQLDPSLAILLKLSDQGFLEAFVLISQPDTDIASDYPAYRDAHPEKIRQYIKTWIIHPGT